MQINGTRIFFLAYESVISDMHSAAPMRNIWDTMDYTSEMLPICSNYFHQIYRTREINGTSSLSPVEGNGEFKTTLHFKALPISRPLSLRQAQGTVMVGSAPEL